MPESPSRHGGSEAVGQWSSQSDGHAFSSISPASRTSQTIGPVPLGVAYGLDSTEAQTT